MFFQKTIEFEILKYLIYTIGFIYLLISFNYGINIYDEGLVLVGGMRLLSGDLPYLDFWTIYAPGTYYISAIIQLLTTQIWMHKFIAIVISFVVALQLNNLYKILTNKKHYYVFATSIILSGFGLKFITPSGVGLLFAIIAINYALKYFKTSDEKLVLKTGIAISVTALFRHDFAMYLFIPFLLSLLFDNDRANLLRKVSKLFLGIIPVLLLYILLALYVGFGNILDQLILFPFTKFSATRSLPFPFLWDAHAISDSMSNYFYNSWIAVMFLVPPVLAIANYIIFRTHKYASLFVFYGLVVLLFYNQALNRSDYAHLLPSLLLTLPLLFSIIISINFSFYRRVALVLVVVFFMLMPMGKKVNFAKKYYMGTEYNTSNIDNLKYIYAEDDILNRYKYISELDEKIIKGGNTFIGLKDMSSIELNDVLAYYILDNLPQTKYHELHPGIADNINYQKELLLELASNNEYVILLDIKPTVPRNGSDYFKENLPKIYSYIIKSPNMDLMINKKEYLRNQ